MESEFAEMRKPLTFDYFNHVGISCALEKALEFGFVEDVTESLKQLLQKVAKTIKTTFFHLISQRHGEQNKFLREGASIEYVLVFSSRIEGQGVLLLVGKVIPRSRFPAKGAKGGVGRGRPRVIWLLGFIESLPVVIIKPLFAVVGYSRASPG